MFNRKAALERRGAIGAELGAFRDLLAKENRPATDAENAANKLLIDESNRLKAQLDLDDQVSASLTGNGSAPVGGTSVIIPGNTLPPVQPFMGATGTNTPSARQRLPRSAPLRVFLDDSGNPDYQLAYDAGMWILGAMGGNDRAIQHCNDRGIPMQRSAVPGAVAQSTSNPQSAFLIPDIFDNTIIDQRFFYGVFRQKARPKTLGGGNNLQPRRKTGYTAYWVSEGQAITESNKEFDQIQLRPKTLAGMSRLSMEATEDAAIDLAQDFFEELAWSFSYSEDDAGFNGDGTSSYGRVVGLKNALDFASSKSILSAAAGHTAITDFTIPDFVQCMGRCRLRGIRPEWYVHPEVWAQSMVRLQYAQGGNTMDNLAGDPRPTFLGRPVNMVEVMSPTTTADAGVIKAYYGDLGMAATMGTAKGITTIADRSRYVEYLQVAVLGYERVDINVHQIGDTVNAGPIVALKTAAA